MYFSLLIFFRVNKFNANLKVRIFLLILYQVIFLSVNIFTKPQLHKNAFLS